MCGRSKVNFKFKSPTSKDESARIESPSDSGRGKGDSLAPGEGDPSFLAFMSKGYAREGYRRDETIAESFPFSK
jgi:hypothetical protein